MQTRKVGNSIQYNIGTLLTEKYDIYYDTKMILNT